MKVVFLDIDGVLNYTNWYTDGRTPGNTDGKENDLDPECVERITRICKETGAVVVLSSTWKLSWYGTIGRLTGVGMPEEIIYDKTPDLTGYGYRSSRGDEIDMWLQAHPDCTNYVIIDDRTDFKDDQQPHTIKIDNEIGITDENVDIAIMILKHH